jgi:uncharacterized OB-fold protein
MPILEKIAQPSRARHWTDSIPLEYHYTAGVAGEEFRRELKEHGRLLASKCAKCKDTYVPARMFCPSCFVEMKETKTLEGSGYVYSYTTVHRDRSGNKSSWPVTIGLVKFEGAKGGIVHRLEADEAEKIAFGTKVTAIMKPPAERTGALTDIIAFKVQ